MTATIRAALYLRVSTSRQADSDLSIPDQRRQAEAYCDSHGWQIVADDVEPGASATDDRRPEFQRMIDAATVKPPMFDVILVHSFSRFFRDQFQLEYYVRRLAKNGVRLVSITQELGDDPMSNMICQIMALFDEVHAAGHEGKRAPRVLEWIAASDRLPHRRRRAARPPHQEDPGDRPLPGRDRAADLPPGVGGQRHFGADGGSGAPGSNARSPGAGICSEMQSAAPRLRKL
jgi:DNA invertase Pin-like site-specific DNA recombinase